MFETASRVPELNLIHKQISFRVVYSLGGCRFDARYFSFRAKKLLEAKFVPK